MDSESIKNTVTIIGCVVSVLSLLGVGTLMSLFWKDKIEKKKQESNENIALREEKRKQQMLEVVTTSLNNALSEQLKPLETAIVDIQNDLAKVKKGVQVSNRNDLEEIADKALDSGYCSLYDKQRFEATYQAYHALGKNGVMDKKRDRLLAMPERKPATKKTTTKKVVKIKKE